MKQYRQTIDRIKKNLEFVEFAKTSGDIKLNEWVKGNKGMRYYPDNGLIHCYKYVDKFLSIVTEEGGDVYPVTEEMKFDEAQEYVELDIEKNKQKVKRVIKANTIPEVELVIIDGKIVEKTIRKEEK